MLQQIIHYGLHLLLPVIVSLVFFRNNWKKATIIMLATMLVDIDHLLANPVFMANRCSIGFHPLHSYLAIGIFIVLTLFRKTRILAVGLLLHMLTDGIDCLWMR
jgi:hypothetical protein